jgi:hypothetical protein
VEFLIRSHFFPRAKQSHVPGGEGGGGGGGPGRRGRVLDVVDGAVLGDLIEPLPDLADTPREVVPERDLTGTPAGPPPPDGAPGTQGGRPPPPGGAVEEVVERVLGLEGDVAGLAHPDGDELVVAEAAAAVGVADEGVEPLELVAEEAHVVAHLQQHRRLPRHQLRHLGQHRRDRRLRHAAGAMCPTRRQWCWSVRRSGSTWRAAGYVIIRMARRSSAVAVGSEAHHLSGRPQVNAAGGEKTTSRSRWPSSSTPGPRPPPKCEHTLLHRCSHVVS